MADHSITSGRFAAPGAADPERLRARLELRRSSAAQRHVPKARKGTRAAARRRAINTGW